jgi:hypothetical protein
MLCLVFKLNIAQVYFNNRYDNYNSCDVFGTISNYQSNYLGTGNACTNNSYYCLNLGLFDYNGIRTNNKTYIKQGSNFLLGFGKNVLMPNTDFIVGGSRFYHTDTSLVFLWRFNSNLDSVKYTEYGYLNKTNYIGAIERQNIYIYMAGSVDSLYKNTDILLIKTDTSGNEIWKKKIGLPNYDETAWCIKISSDNKLLICGNRRLHNNQATNGAFILKADTNGAIIWEKYFPSNYGLAATGMLELPNGDIVAIAGKGYGSTISRYELIKLDASGNVVFDKTYGPMADRAEAYSLIQNQEGNLVAAGQMYYSANNSVNGLMYVFNQNGDSIFSREYAVQPGSQNYFRDLVQAPDKGYVFSGFISPIFANGGTGNQDIWLLKTDSTFCEGAFNCGYPTGLVTLSEVENRFSVYPNPTDGIINIELNLDSYQNKITEIKITDVLGKSVYTYPPLEGAGSLPESINISYLKAGIYFLSLYKNQSLIGTKKIIKE